MHKTRIRIPTLKKASLVMVNLLRWCFLDVWKHLPPLWTAMVTSNKNIRQTEKYRQRNGNASNCRIFMLPGQRENNWVKPGNEKKSCGIPPVSNGWRKDPRSIPKVFLIDAYEVS
jgi:hypothetical protein